MKTPLRRRFRLFTRKDLFELFVCIALAGLFVLLSSGAAFGQGNVGINNPTPHAKSLLDLTSSDKGLLTPRMTAAQRIAMFAAPDATAKGMLVYQTDGAQGYYYYDGAAWQMLQSGGAGWGLLGNAGTNVATNFLGTTDNTSVGFRTNNVERMRLSYTGNLSLGAAIDPVNYRLYVENNAPNHGVLLANTNAAAWAGINCQSNQGAVSQLGVGNSGSGIWANLGYVGTRTNHDFTLITNEIDRVHITAAGNVGIGTSTPARLLEVASLNQAVQRLTSNNTVNGSVVELRNTTAGNNGLGALNFLDGTSTIGQVMYHKADGMTFRTANLERVRIDVNGNVGIGTNTPARLVELASPNQAVQRITSNNAVAGSVLELNNTTAGNNGIGAINFTDNGTALGQLMYYKTLGMTFNTGSTERMRMDVAGNLGVGTAAPLTRMHVVANQAGGMAMTVQNQNAGGWSGTNYTSNTGAGNNTVGFDNATQNGFLGTTSNHPVTFISNWQERMRLTADGNVGIGTNAPGAKFEVLDAGSGIVARFQGTTANGYSVAHWLRSDNAGAHVGFFNPGVGGPLAGNFVMGSFGNAPVSLTTNNVERMRIATDGKVGISTAAPTSELEVNGFTKLGSDGPAIKTKKLTGTTAAAQGSFVDVAHGVTGSKILSVQVLVEYAPGAWIPQSYSHSAGYSVNYLINATNIRVYTETGNSANVLGKPMKLLITYEA